jgi:hypothetical protein
MKISSQTEILKVPVASLTSCIQYTLTRISADTTNLVPLVYTLKSTSSASIFRVKIEAAKFSETLVTYRNTTRRHTSRLVSYRHEKLIVRISICFASGSSGGTYNGLFSLIIREMSLWLLRIFEEPLTELQ